MAEAGKSERRQAYDLFNQLINRALLKSAAVGADHESTARKLTSLLWPYVSTDDKTILDVTLLVTQMREGATQKTMNRDALIAKCDTILDRLRNNPRDAADPAQRV